MDEKDKTKIFPEGFFWGASTASHQVEGGNLDQWSVWELAHATDRAKDAERRLGWQPNWQDIKSQAEDPANYVSGRGVEHYKRYKSDFELIKKMNLNAFRFGIEWSRLEPEEGNWDEAAFAHYKQYISELRAAGLEPFLNIWHWTNPIWFEDKGAFTKKKNLVYFERFVKKVSEELLDNVTYVLTVNEANNYMAFSYLMGEWPPQHKGKVIQAGKVYYNLMLAHRRAYKILKGAKPSLLIGVAHQTTANVPKSPNNIWHRGVARLSNYVWDTWFYKRIDKYQDFIGMNHYHTNYLSYFGLANPKGPLSDIGWYMEPGRIHDVIMRLSRKFDKPIIITENGVADAHDKYRKWWLEEVMAAIELSLKEGADVQGYLHWSLLDNFEWAEGWWPKFGLVEVDHQTMERRMRPSTQWLAKQIEDTQQFKI